MKLSNLLFASSILAVAVPVAAMAQQMPSDLLPPNAIPGHCYARVLVPAAYEPDQSFDVATEDTYVMPRVEGAKFSQPVEREVIAKDGYKTYRVSAPEFSTVNEKIIITPAHHKLIVTPPSARAGAKTYVIRKPTLVWRRGDDLSKVQRINGATGETYCLVEEYGRTINVPYTYYSAKKADVRVVNVAEQSIVNTRQVLTKEARVEEIFVPATLNAKTPRVTTQNLIEDARVVGEYETQARTTKIQTEKMVKNEEYKWVEVACNNSAAQATPVNLKQAPPPPPANVSIPVIRAPKAENSASVSGVRAADVQKRLAELGFYRGPIDNIYGKLTKDAMSRFQAKSGLAVDGKPSVAALKALGF